MRRSYLSRLVGFSVLGLPIGLFNVTFSLFRSLNMGIGCEGVLRRTLFYQPQNAMCFRRPICLCVI